MSSISKGSIDLSDKKKALFKRLQKEAAARLSPQQGPSSASRSHISPRADRSTCPLSLFQERCWWLEQLNPGDPNLQVISALHLDGVLDIAVLRQCLQQLLQRHELLRAVFANLDGTPVQSILPTMPDEIVLLDLAQLDPDAAENAQAQLLVPQQPHSFDLANGPLFKATLVRYTDLKHVLVLSLHAIVADQATPVLLCHELITLYHHAITGHAVALPELPLCHADYASWQQQYLQHAPLEEEQTYWKQQLAGAPLTLNLPFDYQQPAASAPRQASSTLELECALVRQVQDFCQQEEITLSHLLFTVFSLLLSQYTGQKDILSGFLSPNRAAELEPLVGPFADILPIRIQLADELSGQTLLRRVRQILFDASKHQDLPFSQIVEAVYPQHDLTRLPLFQTVFAHHQLPSCQAQSSGLVARFLPLASSLSLQDLAFIFSSSDQSLHLTIVYNNDLFAADSITRLQEHYQQLLRSFLRHRAGPLSRLSCLTPSEQSCLLHDWNADSLAHLPASDQCIHHLFEQQAQRTPHAIALSDGRQQLTYEQLNCQVNQLAHLLQRRGIGPERLVGLCLSRTPDLVIGLLAILKTGAAYVPLDPTYPRERLAFTIQDARLELVLTQKDLVDQMPFSADQALCLDVPGLYTGERSDNITREMSNKHLAYVIYTSGSTGRPKGVCISHWSAVIFLLWARQQFSDEELAGVLFGTSVCFDLSIFELFAPLSWGGKAILASNVLDLPTLAESEYITLLNTVPSAATALLNGANLPSSLLTINLAGEALTRDLVQTLYQRTSVRRVCNLYGPTEDTTYSTWTPVDAEEQGPVPIGRPLANTQAYIVDVHMQLVPLGIAGELYLGGDGQARGYLHRPDLTAERFVPDPFSVVPGRRLYKTGDLARYRPDGTIDYLGRLDHQVKVRGFRIELGEIEAQLRQHPAIEDVVVVAWEEMPGEKRLVAYVVACSEQVLEPSLLRSYLQDLLPAYMIPSFFLMLDALPRTENGKVDRKALPAPDPAKARLTTSAHDLPQGEREQWLALLWQEVLQLAVVGRPDNFFALGGDSLRAMQLLARLQNDFQVHLSLADLFAAPTIAQLADRCRTATLQPVLEPIAALRPRLVSPDMAFPLSSGQQRLWFVDQLEAGTAMYNVPLILALTGPLNRLALYQALHEMIRRHETLRTTIRVSKGSPFLSIADCPRPALALVDLSLALGADALEVEKPYECPAVLRKMREEVQRPFDLSSGPLLRVCLLCVKENYHILMLTMHHIITDGWSLNILTQELNTLYNAFAAGHPSPLPELAIQYRDFVAWQHTHQAQNFGAGLAYWKECFTPLPSPLALPTDYPRPAMQTFVGDSLRFQIGHELTQEIHAISQQEGVTTFMTLLTAFLVVLMRYSGQEDLVVGTPVANRSRTELERLVGFFVNTLALRADLSGNPTGRELLQRVRVVTLDAYSYQEIPFEQVVEAVQPQRDPSRSPLFQVLFVLQNTPAFALNLAGLSAQTVEVLPPTAQFDLSFILEESPSGLNLTIEYNTQLFAQATIERLQAHYKNLLHSLCTQLDIAIQNLPLLNESECTQIVADWKQPAAASLAERYLHELFSTVDEAKEFPIANIHCYVLDVLQRPVPIGMVGELYLAGEIVSRGYLEQPGLTAQRFMPDLLSEQPGQRMYRTGDWVYRRADGELVYVERVDQQVRPRHNGKKALSMPDQVYPAEQDVVADLQSPEEEKLLQIWRRVLRRVVVGRRDNFFEIGGHSLLAMQVLAAIREELHTDLSIRQFFAAPTIAELAAVIASGVAPEPMLHDESQKDALPSLVPVARTSELPLSFAQQRLWFLDQ
ncbi:MAG TPA: amino acid adenylation domain-containing protein, partial [Ktedonobacteraceae bacterium]|nr:amino acid adenylation domain-containing protein [Ktedonobacteraceae bacterium]